MGLGAVFWIVGHLATPFLKAAADGSLGLMRDWISRALNQVMSAHPDLGGILFGLIFGFIQAVAAVFFGAFVMALALVAIAAGRWWPAHGRSS